MTDGTHHSPPNSQALSIHQERGRTSRAPGAGRDLEDAVSSYSLHPWEPLLAPIVRHAMSAMNIQVRDGFLYVNSHAAVWWL